MRFFFNGDYSRRDKRLLAFMTQQVIKAMFAGTDHALFFNETVSIIFEPRPHPACNRCLGVTFWQPRSKKIYIQTLPNVSHLLATALSTLISHEIWHYWSWMLTFDRCFANNGVHWFVNTGGRPEVKTITSKALLRLFKFRLQICYYAPFSILTLRPLIERRVKAGEDKGFHEYWCI